jgi:hypothetical protein
MSENIRPEVLITASKEQVSCELGGEAVILQTGDGVYYGLNAVGNSAWQLLQKGPHKFAEIVDSIVAEFEVERHQCELDLTALFREMAGAKLLNIGT